ncbi:MAG: hypothetical protein FWH05_02725 [Oscillospiraceae bacterium]|nr:hypothetical protein [Oscillospiraceae bacterium]
MNVKIKRNISREVLRKAKLTLKAELERTTKIKRTVEIEGTLKVNRKKLSNKVVEEHCKMAMDAWRREEESKKEEEELLKRWEEIESFYVENDRFEDERVERLRERNLRAWDEGWRDIGESFSDGLDDYFYYWGVAGEAAWDFISDPDVGEVFTDAWDDIYGGLSNNYYNMMDDFNYFTVMNYLTMGFTDGTRDLLESTMERGREALSEPTAYNIGNWLTLGYLDTVESAFNPEKAFSYQHFKDSIDLAAPIFGVALGKFAVASKAKAVKTVGKTNQNVKKTTSKPVKPAKPAKPVKPIGREVDLKGKDVQLGVDPRSEVFKPRKDLSRLNKQNLATIEKLVQERKLHDAVTISRDGTILEGHHRLANAIKNGRAIDVIIE